MIATMMGKLEMLKNLYQNTKKGKTLMNNLFFFVVAFLIYTFFIHCR